MFNSGSARRRKVRPNSQCSFHKRGRILRAEALEGRMMLSAASPTLSTALQSLPMGGEIDQRVSFKVGQGSIAPLLPVEGGFVLSGHFNTNSSAPIGPVVVAFDSTATIAELLSAGSTLSADG